MANWAFLSELRNEWPTAKAANCAVLIALTLGSMAFGAAFLPVGQLADFSNAGTLFGFAVVALSVLVLRRTQPDRRRPFRVPLLWLFAPLSIAGCILLFVFLPGQAQLRFLIWAGIGLVFYFSYGYRHSHVGRGVAGADSLRLAWGGN